jgi:hypothetical protein
LSHQEDFLAVITGFFNKFFGFFRVILPPLILSAPVSGRGYRIKGFSKAVAKGLGDGFFVCRKRKTKAWPDRRNKAGKPLYTEKPVAVNGSRKKAVADELLVCIATAFFAQK